MRICSGVLSGSIDTHCFAEKEHLPGALTEQAHGPS